MDKFGWLLLLCMFGKAVATAQTTTILTIHSQPFERTGTRVPQARRRRHRRVMKQFYQGRLGEQQLSPAAALRAAQLKMLKTARWQAPYYWAAFTLQGEW